MNALHDWMNAQFAEHRTEPNSGLGKAISYLLNHWTKLTLFLLQSGALNPSIIAMAPAISSITSVNEVAASDSS
jgi:hypothetical protein